jgi:hypothetical protein
MGAWTIGCDLLIAALRWLGEATAGSDHRGGRERAPSERLLMFRMQLRKRTKLSM